MQRLRARVAPLFRIVDRRLVPKFVLAAVLSAAITGLDAAGILLLVPLADSLTSDASTVDLPVLGTTSLAALLGLIVGFFVLKSVLMAMARWWIMGVVVRASVQSSTELLRTYVRAPLSFHSNSNSADLVRNVVVAIRTIMDQVVLGSVLLISDLASSLLLLLVLAVVQPVVAVAALAYFIAGSLLFSRGTRRLVNRHAERIQALLGLTIRQVTEAAGLAPDLAQRGTAESFIAPFSAHRLDLERSRRVVKFVSEGTRWYLEVLFIGGFALVLGSAWLLTDADGTLAVLAVFLGVGLRSLPAVSRALRAVSNIRAGWASVEVVQADLDRLGLVSIREATATDADLQEYGGSAPALVVDGVSHRFSGRLEPALVDISFSLDSGSMVGFAGESGSGKSTLALVVSGAINATEGTTSWTVDGAPVRPKIAMVRQQTVVIDGTIRDNVTLGLELDDLDVWRALELAELAEFVSGLPDDLGARVGEAGSLLSGGQLQRLGLARALALSPEVLVLDEATSALDLVTERAVMSTVERLRGALTVVVIAHRLSTLTSCDEVLYLESGRVAHRGSIEALLHDVPALSLAQGDVSPPT